MIDVIFGRKKSKDARKNVNNLVKQRLSLIKNLKNVITNYTNRKLAAAGITYDNMLKLFQNDGRRGIVQILAKKDSNKPLIKDKKTIDKICEHFSNLNSMST